MVFTASLCVPCKGSRHLCGHKPCPLLVKYAIQPKIEPKLKDEFYGLSQSIFVGHEGYPNVFVGPMQALDEKYESAGSILFGKTYESIIESMSSAIRSKYLHNVKQKTKFVELNQELAISSKPAYIEAYFRKKPRYEIRFSDVTQPQGPSAELKEAKPAGNISADHRIERVASNNIKSAEASRILYNKGIDVYKLTTVLSSGVLGARNNRKLVPTRWSITAVDDLIGKQLIEEIKQFNPVSDFLVFSSAYMDNHFEILLMPGCWEFENFEAWAPGSTWAQDLKSTYVAEEYESYQGRTKYADKQAGGYYAARLGVLEGLKQLRRQASVVSFREVSEGYVIPLGVWVVRETVRNAFKSKPAKFSTRKEAIEHVSSKLKLNMFVYKQKSQLLRQKKLMDFF